MGSFPKGGTIPRSTWKFPYIIEVVFPINNGDIPASYVIVYQRVGDKIRAPFIFWDYFISHDIRIPS